MRMKLQHFFLVVFAILFFLLVAIWSLSLFFSYAASQEASRSLGDFLLHWALQALWVIPLLLIPVVGLYALLFNTLIRPLLKITRNMQHDVIAQHPLHGRDKGYLTPGLKLLQQYFLRLKQLTKHDALTGLNNRIIFEERLQQAVLEGRRSGRRYALVFIDIDDFHQVNHELGPYIGDGVLRQLAKRLSNGLRETDSVARLEEDNFALLLEYAEQDQITNLVGKIYQYLTRNYTVYGRKIRIKVSVGVALYPDHGQDADTLALSADQALLRAQKGEWPVEFFKLHSNEAVHQGFSLIQSLVQAIENDEFKLVYQPVMDLQHHSTSYFEALLRWKDPEQHDPIENTIELAEKNQLIKPLTNWIIESACKQLQLLSHPSIKIAVNLSMIDLHDEQLPERVHHILQNYGVMPRQILIEITEGQIMQEPEQVIAILHRLSAMGIALLIDDFGTGQASLTYLRKLPVEKIKIDQSFVKDMVSNEEDRTIVEATINLAHTLGIKVVAEGVESSAIHELLMQMHCDYIQGYYISHPLEQDQILNWCDQQQVLTAS
ncbi:MAG: EAL domain-containing protein [Gammaproteobacteria bacterium]|nr:EAL domain-containing protein [Gammaproteobacteria bacterium]